MSVTPEKKSKPYGNLSFSEYTFDTEAEKLVIALQAAMKVQGLTIKSKSWRAAQKLKKAMLRSKKYTFKPVPRTKKVEEAAKVEFVPSAEQADTVSEIVGHCLGLSRKKYTVRGTSAKYGLVRAVYVGAYDELRIPPNPDHLVTEDRAKREISERARNKDINEVRVMSFVVKKNRKKNRAVVLAEFLFR